MSRRERRLFVTCGVSTRYFFVAFPWLFVALFRLEKQCLGLFVAFSWFFRGFIVAFSWPLFCAKFTRTRPGTVFWIVFVQTHRELIQKSICLHLLSAKTSSCFRHSFSGFRKRGLANGVSPFFFPENETKKNGRKQKKRKETEKKMEENGKKRKETEQTEENGKKRKKTEIKQGKNGRKRKKTEEKGKNRKRHLSGDPFCKTPSFDLSCRSGSSVVPAHATKNEFRLIFVCICICYDMTLTLRGQMTL